MLALVVLFIASACAAPLEDQVSLPSQDVPKQQSVEIPVVVMTLPEPAKLSEDFVPPVELSKKVAEMAKEETEVKDEVVEKQEEPFVLKEIHPDMNQMTDMSKTTIKEEQAKVSEVHVVQQQEEAAVKSYVKDDEILKKVVMVEEVPVVEPKEKPLVSYYIPNPTTTSTEQSDVPAIKEDPSMKIIVPESEPLVIDSHVEQVKPIVSDDMKTDATFWFRPRKYYPVYYKSYYPSVYYSRW